jgi:hypothetical protein
MLRQKSIEFSRQKFSDRGRIGMESDVPFNALCVFAEFILDAMQRVYYLA